MFCKTSTENDLEIQLCGSIDDVKASDWIAVIDDTNFFLSIPYLKILEGDSGYGMEFRYALVYKNNQPVAAGYFQVVQFSGEELRPYIPNKDLNGTIQKLNRKFQSFLSQGLSRINWNLLVSGNIFATGECGFHYLPDRIDAEDALSVLREVMEMISENSNDSQKIRVFLIKDFYQKQTNGDGPLIRNHFRKLHIEADMFMNVDPDWKTFDDYLASISSKYRVRAKKVFKKSEGLKIQEMSLTEIKANRKRIFELYMNVANGADFNLAYLTENYFSDIKETFNNNFKLIGYYFDNKLVGFISNFIVRDELEVHFVGLDYHYNRSHAVYQRILYDDIRLAISNGMKRIHFGRTAQEIKSTVGARPRKMFSYLKHKSIVPNLVIKPLSEYLKPQEWVLRNPFKDKQFIAAS